MKSKFSILTLLVFFGLSGLVQAQQVTGQGNSQRHSRYQQYGPIENNQIWETNLPYCFLTMPTWYYDGKAYFGRYNLSDDNSIDPSKYSLEELLRFLAVTEIHCMNIETGELLWATTHGKSLIIIGIQDSLIYCMDYTGGAGSNYMSALNAETGDIEWEFPYPNACGISQTAAFAPNGDLILPGPNLTNGLQRVSGTDGSTIWQVG